MHCDVNTQTKGLAYGEPTRMDLHARRKIGMLGKGKGRTYMTFLYHACQALGVKITTDGVFKVNVHNGDLEGRERVMIIGNVNNRMGPCAQAMLNSEKLAPKEYTKRGGPIPGRPRNSRKNRI
jgi:hypothetical protein